jgi:hypothetical protein
LATCWAVDAPPLPELLLDAEELLEWLLEDDELLDMLLDDAELLADELLEDDMLDDDMLLLDEDILLDDEDELDEVGVELMPVPELSLPPQPASAKVRITHDSRIPRFIAPSSRYGRRAARLRGS